LKTRRRTDLLSGQQGIGFKSFQENIDTGSGVEKLVFHIIASLAEFERGIIRERTLAGLESARAPGGLGGIPKFLDKKKSVPARAMHRDKNIPVNEICSTL